METRTLETRVNYDPAVTVAQTWVYWRYAWAQYYRGQLGYLMWIGIGAILSIIAALLGFSIFSHSALIYPFVLLFIAVAPFFKCFRSYLSFRKYLATINVPAAEIYVGFDHVGIWQRGADPTAQRDEVAWERITGYVMHRNILMIQYDGMTMPILISRSEVPDDYYWELMAEMERRANFTHSNDIVLPQ